MSRMCIRKLALGVALAAAAGGCALPTPPEKEDLRTTAAPNIHLPEHWASGTVSEADVASGWLGTFHDPALEKLVAEAIAYNPDLRVAAARVEAAEASARAAGATLYPQLNLLGKGGGKMGGGETGLNIFGLFASWEIDLWGHVRGARAGATATYEATALELVYARESIAALVAKSWFLAREAGVQRSIAHAMVASSESLSDLARDRFQIGKGDEYEATQAEAGTLAYRDLELQADLARRNALRAIEILAGRYPSASVDAGLDLPEMPAAPPVGLPSQLLERRPDVRAAERRVAASYYRVHEAQAARLPRIALTASVNTVSSDLVFLKERDNPLWSVGGNLLWPIFAGGALQAQVEVRTAEQKAALAEYARTGARAFDEVEGALSASFNLEERAAVLARAVAANERALGFARVRYDVGSGDLRGVQQQLLSLHTARTSLVHVQAERLIQRVNLHLALGGSFEPGAGKESP